VDDRRTFLGLCAGAVAAALDAGPAEAAPSRTTSRPMIYDGIMGRGYARGPHGLVHFWDSAGLVTTPRLPLPLVLLHQSPQSARQFERAFQPLVARGVRFVAIDTPGFGFSDPTPAFPRLEDWAGSIVAVLDHLGIERADVLGHHTGALIATEVALQSPARVRRLILNGPFPITAEERRSFIQASDDRHGRDAPVVSGAHFVSSFETRVRMWGTETPPDPAVLTRTIAEKYQGLGPYTWGHDAAFRYDHAASLMRLAHPALILTNTGDDIYELAKRASKMRPDFAWHEIAGGSHDIVDQKPEEWCDAVVQFLRQADHAAGA
jgi:pimeloyl-ACP methyl ester carboxylesterase